MSEISKHFHPSNLPYLSCANRKEPDGARTREFFAFIPAGEQGNEIAAFISQKLIELHQEVSDKLEAAGYH